MCMGGCGKKTAKAKSATQKPYRAAAKPTGGNPFAATSSGTKVKFGTRSR